MGYFHIQLYTYIASCIVRLIKYIPTEEVEFRKEQTMQNCKMPYVITNNDTCKSAADFFGLTYKGNFTSDTRPAGCWFQNDDVYFNFIIDQRREPELINLLGEVDKLN